MLYRTSVVRHPDSGLTLKTPLLIPSFSSRGFPRSDPIGKSDIGRTLETAGEFLTEVLLISAYDLYHGDLPQPADLPCRPELIFVDSGGYEVSDDDDYSAVVDARARPQPWATKKLESVYDGWPDEIPAVFVSYDHPRCRQPLAGQVADARRLFRTHRGHLTLLLLKPEKAGQETLDRTIRAAVADPEQLGFFDIIGVAEKELGRTMLGRMAEIAKLRMAMTNAGVTAPVHVFGALDPLTVLLYFISGAEIFDGLTWLRYAYRDGMCIYRHNFGASTYGLNATDDQVRLRTLVDNIYSLQALKQQMQVFAATGGYDQLEPHSVLMAKAYEALRTRLNGGL